MECEELMLKASVTPLRQEATSLSRHYENQKRFLFAYSAAMLRSPCVATPDSQIIENGSRGSTALMRVLAERCGWPEVAFLRLMPVRNPEKDARWAGRLNAEDLGTGLLLGAGIDYPALTASRISVLFNAIDQRGL